MDYSSNNLDELLAFKSSPELEAAGSVGQALALAKTVLEGFDFSQSNAEDPESEAQSSWLYSEDSNLFDQQMGYKEFLSDELQAKSTLNSDSFAIFSPNQEAASISTTANPMVSSNRPASSSPPIVQPPISSVAPASLSLPSLPSPNFDLGLDLFPELQDYYPHGQPTQEQYEWTNQQNLEEIRLEQEIPNQERVEQVRVEQHRVEHARAEAFIFADLLQAAENQVAFQTLKPDIDHLNVLPQVQATAAQEPRGEMNQPIQGPYNKTAKRLREAKNSRSANIASFVASEHFIPLPEPPRSWGKINPKTGRPVYEYSPDGELIPHYKYNEQQIREYLTNHPLHSNGLLTLWVQISPADSGGRYPDAEHSSKCRFKNCSIQNWKIAIGEYRIAFDEQSWKLLPYDPCHNAGYVHLYCLEKNLDFPQLCKDFNVQPDTRPTFAGQKNRMAITRDFPEMERVVNNFIRDSKPWNGGRRSDTWYPKTLCYALTLEQLKREPRTRQSTRDGRNGNSVDKHINNLDLKEENNNRKKEGLPWKVFERPAADKPVVEKIQTKKRKSDDKAEANPPGSPPKKSKVAQQASRAEKPEAKPISPMKKPQTPRTLMRKSEWSSSAMRPKVMEDFSENDSAYDRDESGSSTPPTERQKEAWNKSRVVEEEVGRPVTPAMLMQRPKSPKRKVHEIEEGERDPNEEFQELCHASMKRYGLNMRYKGDTAGLKTPLGDMLHLPY